MAERVLELFRDAIRDRRNRNIHLTEVSRIILGPIKGLKSIIKLTHIEYLYDPTTFSELHFHSTLNARGIMKSRFGNRQESDKVFIKFSPKCFMPFTSNRHITDDLIERFQKELFIYNIVIPRFAQLQNDLTIDQAGHYLCDRKAVDPVMHFDNIFPMCFGSRCAISAKEEKDNPSKAGVIILEDLKESQFLPYVSPDPREPLPYDIMRAVLVKLASLHSLSFVFNFNTINNTNSWCYVTNIREAMCFTQSHLDYIVENIKNIPELTYYREFIIERLNYSLRHGADPPRVTVNHYMQRKGLTFGLATPHNIMVQKDLEGNVIDCRLVDCQHMQMRHLLSDVAMLLITWCHPTLFTGERNEYPLLVHDYLICLEEALKRLFNAPFKFVWKRAIDELRRVVQKELLKGLTYIKYLSVKREFVADMRCLANWPNFKPKDIEDKIDKELYLKKLKYACLGLIDTKLIYDPSIPKPLSTLAEVDSENESSQNLKLKPFKKSKVLPIKKRGRLSPKSKVKPSQKPKAGSSQEPEPGLSDDEENARIRSTSESSYQLFEELEKISNLSADANNPKKDFKKLSSMSIISQLHKSSSHSSNMSLDFSIGSTPSTSKHFADISSSQASDPYQKIKLIGAKVWEMPRDRYGGVYIGPSTTAGSNTGAIKKVVDAPPKRKKHLLKKRGEVKKEAQPEDLRLANLTLKLKIGGQHLFRYKRKLKSYSKRAFGMDAEGKKVQRQIMEAINQLRDHQIETINYNMLDEYSREFVNVIDEYEMLKYQAEDFGETTPTPLPSSSDLPKRKLIQYKEPLPSPPPPPPGSSNVLEAESEDFEEPLPTPSTPPSLSNVLKSESEDFEESIPIPSKPLPRSPGLLEQELKNFGEFLPTPPPGSSNVLKSESEDFEDAIPTPSTPLPHSGSSDPSDLV